MSDHLTFSVDGLGTFVCRHRTIGSQIKVAQAYRQHLGGPETEAPSELQYAANLLAELETLLVSWPAGFDLGSAHVLTCQKIHLAMVAEEARFLGQLAAHAADAGDGAEPDPAVVVPGPLSPDGDRSAPA